ncbi:MAG: hypothetical protein GF308_20965 [Candidatus Heimdallarchaeota archaeon]|nr:hypothetical protein [Candidatus Heimdallarchaeota archaeon]
MPSLKEKKTDLLFWKNAYLKEFTAKVIAVLEKGIVLDQTLFYPRGGGQPSDKGWLWIEGDKEHKFKVVSVIKTKEGIVHQLANSPPQKLKDKQVLGTIDWNRRYALMRAHSSQHLFSAMIVKFAGIETQKADIREKEVKIHLEQSIPEEVLQKAFIETNKVIQSNKTITANHFSVATLPIDIEKKLRGDLETKGKEVRIVSITGIDQSLCGGIHCKTTGEIGFIFLSDFKGETIAYSLGSFAINDFAQANIDLIACAKMLAAQPTEVRSRIKTLVEERDELEREKREISQIGLTCLIQRLKEAPIKKDRVRIFTENFEFAEREYVLKSLGGLPDNSLFVFVVKGPLLLVLSTIPELSAKELINEFIEETGTKGGGSPKIAQAAVEEPNRAIKVITKIIEKRL